MLGDPKDGLLYTPASYREGFRFSRVESDARCTFVQVDGFFYNGEVGSRGHKSGHVIGVGHNGSGACAAPYPCTG